MTRPAALAARLASAGARHRAPGLANTRTHGHAFVPRHCGGDTCLHDHPGQTRVEALVAAGQPGKAAFVAARRDLAALNHNTPAS